MVLFLKQLSHFICGLLCETQDILSRLSCTRGIFIPPLVPIVDQFECAEGANPLGVGAFLCFMRHFTIVE